MARSSAQIAIGNLDDVPVRLTLETPETPETPETQLTRLASPPE